MKFKAHDAFYDYHCNALLFAAVSTLQSRKSPANSERKRNNMQMVQTERSLYNSMMHRPPVMIVDWPLWNRTLHVATWWPCTTLLLTHRNFTWRPSAAEPYLFVIPRKCAVFGVCCEAVPQQVNFQLHQAKCANAAVSYLHFFF